VELVKGIQNTFGMTFIYLFIYSNFQGLKIEKETIYLARLWKKQITVLI